MRGSAILSTLPGVCLALSLLPMVTAAATSANPEVASRTPAGGPGNAASVEPAVSADGRFVAFASQATDLLTDKVDANGAVSDIFVLDRQTGVVELVSINSTGGQGNGRSQTPAISADGRYVAFSSSASNLVLGDTNGRHDVFVHDRQERVTARVSVDSAGGQGNGDSYQPAISADGRFVVFNTGANDLASGPEQSLGLLLHDRHTGQTQAVPAQSHAGPVSWAREGELSGDGRYVVFTAAVLDVDRGTHSHRAFLWDRQTGASQPLFEHYLFDMSDEPSISADGRFVAFTTSVRLIFEDTNGWGDVYVMDRQNGTYERVSVATDGTEASGGFEPVISADGRVVAMLSSMPLAGGVDSNQVQVFSHDRESDTTRLVAEYVSDGSSTFGSRVALNGDGTVVSWVSAAADLVAADTNNSSDVFLRTQGIPRFDTTSPELTLPGPVTVEATGPTGGRAEYTVQALDDTDTNIVPICDHPSGATFALGSTAVSCTATDTAGNSATGSFTVTVTDNTAARLRLPRSRVVNATSPRGARVTYQARATDTVDANPNVQCQPRTGSMFRPGSTRVRCTATDTAGNTGTGGFTVTVRGAAGQLTQLSRTLRVMPLRPRAERALRTEVTRAQRQLNSGRIRAACQSMNKFGQTVGTQQRQRQLTTAQARRLRGDASRIRGALGC